MKFFKTENEAIQNRQPDDSCCQIITTSDERFVIGNLDEIYDNYDILDIIALPGDK